MTELTDRQQPLLDEFLQNFKGNTRDLFGDVTAKSNTPIRLSTSGRENRGGSG